MTLVIGLKCSDGIVMGADGAATTSDSLGQYTIRQIHKKLQIISGTVAVGNSGPVGLAQMIREEIKNLWNGRGLSNKTPCQAMKIIQDKMWPHVSAALQAATVARQAVGNMALQSALCNTLVALPVSKEPCLIQFDHQCAPELATRDLPFVSIGIGQQIADPFLAFLKRIFWSKKEPNIIMGTFAVYWTLEHAIQIHPGGVANPKQIVILEHINKGWHARELAPNELQEHAEAIAAAENHLRKYPSIVTNPEIEEPPKPQ